MEVLCKEGVEDCGSWETGSRWPVRGRGWVSRCEGRKVREERERECDSCEVLCTLVYFLFRKFMPSMLGYCWIN